MDSIRDFLFSPFGRLFSHLLKAFMGALFVCGGIQLFDFKNLPRFFTLRKIIGLFLLAFGSSLLIYVLFHLAY
jgi:hypothetical protein